LGFGFGRYRRRDARVVIPDFSAFLGCILSFSFGLPSLFYTRESGVVFILRCFGSASSTPGWTCVLVLHSMEFIVISLTALCFATNSSP